MHAGRLERLGMLAGMHALTTRAITHDSTTFETIPIDLRALGLRWQLQQPLVFMLKTHSTTQNPTTSTGRTLQLAGHTGSHPGTPFEVCPSRITAQTGHKVHKGSASTDGTVTMPTHGATKPSACKFKKQHSSSAFAAQQHMAMAGNLPDAHAAFACESAR